MTRLLVDTHALLWWFTDDHQLSSRARELIGDTANDVVVSAASAWEVATEQRLGKLPDAPRASERFSELTARNGFTHLPVTHLHALRAGGYPVAHRDPFDRMLAAQCELEQLLLVTRDPAFGDFPVETIW